MTIDANIVIAYLWGDPKIIDTLSLWKEEGKPLFLSTVAETEILSFSGWTQKEQLETEQFIEGTFTSISFDRTLARIAAEIRRKAKIKFPDAAIAATAIFTRTPIVTRNERDFRKIPNLPIVTL